MATLGSSVLNFADPNKKKVTTVSTKPSNPPGDVRETYPTATTVTKNPNYSVPTSKPPTTTTYRPPTQTIGGGSPTYKPPTTTTSRPPTTTSRPPTTTVAPRPKPVYTGPPTWNENPMVPGYDPTPVASRNPSFPTIPGASAPPPSPMRPGGGPPQQQQQQAPQQPAQDVAWPQEQGQQQGVPPGLAQLAAMMVGAFPSMEQNLSVNMPFNQKLPFQVGREFGGDNPYLTRGAMFDPTGVLGRNWGG